MQIHIRTTFAYQRYGYHLTTDTDRQGVYCFQTHDKKWVNVIGCTVYSHDSINQLQDALCEAMDYLDPNRS